MDTEGGEVKILPQLKPWIAQYKPTILLSLVRRPTAATVPSSPHQQPAGAYVSHSAH